MSKEIEVSCPGCNAIFSVPVEFCGEMAECDECDTIFEIPQAEKIETLPKTDSGAIKGVAAGDDFDTQKTHTVKVSRSGIGMVPSLKDRFEFGTIEVQTVQSHLQPPQKTVSPHPNPNQPPPSRPPTKIPPPIPSTIHTDFTEIAPVAQKKSAVKLPSWTRINMQRGEQPLGFQQTKKKAFVIALLISMPAFIAGISILFTKINSYLAIAFAVVVWLTTFGVALFIAWGKRYKALVLTTHRAIYFDGKERTEVKK